MTWLLQPWPPSRTYTLLAHHICLTSSSRAKWISSSSLLTALFDNGSKCASILRTCHVLCDLTCVKPLLVHHQLFLSFHQFFFWIWRFTITRFKKFVTQITFLYDISCQLPVFSSLTITSLLVFTFWVKKLYHFYALVERYPMIIMISLL